MACEMIITAAFWNSLVVSTTLELNFLTNHECLAFEREKPKFPYSYSPFTNAQSRWVAETNLLLIKSQNSVPQVYRLPLMF